MLKLSLSLVAFCGFLIAEPPSGRVEYIAGTLNLGTATNGVLDCTDGTSLSVRLRSLHIAIPYRSISSLRYESNLGGDAEVPLASDLPSELKKRQGQFLAIRFVDAQNTPQTLVFKVNKKDVHAILMELARKTAPQVGNALTAAYSSGQRRKR